MTNKMAARALFYAQGLPSYANSKGAKLKKFTKNIVYPFLSWLVAIRFFGCGKEWYHFQRELMVSKIVV